jgi:hypothetical protein
LCFLEKKGASTSLEALSGRTYLNVPGDAKEYNTKMEISHWQRELLLTNIFVSSFFPIQRAK